MRILQSLLKVPSFSVKHFRAYSLLGGYSLISEVYVKCFDEK